MHPVSKDAQHSLDRIIWRLEAWQNRKDVKDHVDQHDLNKAKGLLMDALRRLEENNHAPRRPTRPLRP